MPGPPVRLLLAQKLRWTPLPQIPREPVATFSGHAAAARLIRLTVALTLSSLPDPALSSPTTTFVDRLGDPNEQSCLAVRDYAPIGEGGLRRPGCSRARRRSRSSTPFWVSGLGTGLGMDGP